MRVTLIDYTGSNGTYSADAYAADILIFTKNTRLNMTPDAFEDVMQDSYEQKMVELDYMSNTIPSSWEFVHYTFLIEGVTRAFTHQFVRSRNWSFAQQTMRVLDVSGWTYGVGPSILNNPELHGIYAGAMDAIARAYDELIAKGAKIEDARGVLPTNIHTNIVGSCNMRTFVDTVRKRSSVRTQGEYRDVVEAMKEEVRAVHPWIDKFIDRDVDRALADIEARHKEDITTVKLVDQLRAKL